MSVIQALNDEVGHYYDSEVAEELADLKQKGWLNWRGHNLLRYWKYGKIMKEYD